MRLKITLNKNGFIIPVAYQSILQGLIYSLLAKNNLGDFYHDDGYHYDKKVFKCFTFSQLFGKYKVEKNNLIFDDMFYFYLSSQDELFLKDIYHTLLNNETLSIAKQTVKIKNIDIIERIRPFNNNKSLILQTLSPVLTYTTSNDFSNYYALSNKKANNLIINNIINKAKAYNYPIDEIVFEIENIIFEKKRMVKYKNCYYPAYISKFEVLTNYQTLLFVYNCGLSSKNSCGFGMIDLAKE